MSTTPIVNIPLSKRPKLEQPSPTDLMPIQTLVNTEYVWKSVEYGKIQEPVNQITGSILKAEDFNIGDFIQVQEVAGVKKFVNVTEEEIKNIVLGSVKKYVALLSQSGTDAPVATVLENTIGSLAWIRDSFANYRLNSNGLFTLNKTVVLLSKYIAGGINGSIIETYEFVIESLDENDLTISTWRNRWGSPHSSAPFEGGAFNNTPIEIRVYP